MLALKETEKEYLLKAAKTEAQNVQDKHSKELEDFRKQIADLNQQKIDEDLKLQEQIEKQERDHNDRMKER